jgi:hypothetical protein
MRPPLAWPPLALTVVPPELELPPLAWPPLAASVVPPVLGLPPVGLPPVLPPPAEPPALASCGPSELSSDEPQLDSAVARTTSASLRMAMTIVQSEALRHPAQRDGGRLWRDRLHPGHRKWPSRRLHLSQDDHVVLAPLLPSFLMEHSSPAPHAKPFAKTSAQSFALSGVLGKQRQSGHAHCGGTPWTRRAA